MYIYMYICLYIFIGAFNVHEAYYVKICARSICKRVSEPV